MRKRKTKPTVKQIKALQLMNGGMSKRQAMIQAGYSTYVAEKPYKDFLGAAGVKSQIVSMATMLEDAKLNTVYMVEKFKEWLEAQKVVSARVVAAKGKPSSFDEELEEADSKTDDFIEVPDYKTQLEAYKEWKKVMDQASNPDTTGKKVSRKMTIEEFINE